MASETPTTPAPLRDAATVVLVRDGAAGIEVFLQRRVKQMAFAGGMTVFPGGGVDARDAEADIGWTGPGPDRWAQSFGTDTDTAQALVCAAVRETFEECGVLLAGDSDGALADPSALAHERARLVDKSISFADFLRTHGLTLRADLLRPLAHWITPVNEPRRYDTRFFLAAMPDGQQADGATTEAEIAGWVTPRESLDLWKAGKHFLLPPTWAQLIEVASYDNVDDLLASSRTIEPIEPDVSSTGDNLIDLRFRGAREYFEGLGDAGLHL